jgi:hypothetical protein
MEQAGLADQLRHDLNGADWKRLSPHKLRLLTALIGAYGARKIVVSISSRRPCPSGKFASTNF